MINDIIANINKNVLITLTNGKEIEGLVIGIDIETNTIKLRDNNERPISLLISMIGMMVPIGNLKKNDSTSNKPGPESLLDNEVAQLVTPNHLTATPETIQRVAKLEATFDAEIKNASLVILQPDFITPPDIANLGHYADELKVWNWIKNKYEYGLKMGKLVPNSDDLRAIVDRVRNLAENPKLLNSALLNSYLGYFSYLNKNKIEAIKAYRKAAKLSRKAEDWLNLAVIAEEAGEKEIACHSLENLFLQVSCASSEYTKAWYKFMESVIYFSTYSSINKFLNRELLKIELDRIFESVCYFLLRNERKDIVQKFIESYSSKRSEIKALIIEGLKSLPQNPDTRYRHLVNEWEPFSSLHPIKITTENKVKSKKKKAKLSISSASKYIATSTTMPSKSNQDKDFYRRITELITTKGKEEEGETLLREAINRNINKQSAVRDLAMLLDRNKRTSEAIETIEKNQSFFAEQDKNLLYNLYFKNKDFEKAIAIQLQILKVATTSEKRAKSFSLIANCYSSLENYEEADNYFNKAILLSPSNYAIRRGIAFSYYKRGKIEESKALLYEIIQQYDDGPSKLFLEQIKNSSENLSEEYLDELSIDINLNIVADNIDKFVYFFLERCGFENVDKTHIVNGKYLGTEEEKENDIKKLISFAGELKTKIAEGRSKAYLSAAKILFDKEEQDQRFYRYLCRSFASMGDNAIQSRDVHLETARAYYLTSMQVYDSLVIDDETKKSREQDAFNALCRYLYSFLGREKVPLVAGHKRLDIRETWNDIFSYKIDFKNIFDAMKVAIAKSPQFAGKRLINILIEDSQHKAYLNKYFKSENFQSNGDFIKQWNELANQVKIAEDNIFNELYILHKVHFQQTWIETNIDRINKVIEFAFYDLDKKYLIDLYKVFNLCLDLCKSIDFDTKMNKSDDIKTTSERLLTEIEKNPTKLSIEKIYPIINNLRLGLERFMEEVYNKSKPDLVCISSFPTYQYRDGNILDIQIRIENKSEGHAEQVYLKIEPNGEYFESISPAILYNTIRGKSHETKIMTLRLTGKAILEKAFSAQVCAEFTTRQNKSYETPLFSLPVQIGETDDFVEIKPNPYANGASGKTVTNDEMFYGREAYIAKAYKTMIEDAVSYVIYGQFRSGKSSILEHLERRLEKNSKIVVAKLGDIGAFMGESNTPMYYRFLHRILITLKDGIDRKVKDGVLKPLVIVIPDSKSFYEHPSPSDYFYEIMDCFQQKKSESDDWKEVRVVVTIDEFSYIYGQIVQGKISDDFMKTWKALLAKEYFNVVLVSQDVFPKFYAAYENQFGTISQERITYLDGPSARGLIDDPIKRLNNGESKFKENAIDKIIDLTAGHPWYIQIFCNALVNYINSDRQPYITGANIDIVKERLLRGAERKDNFKNFIENGDPSPDAIPQKDIIKVLKKIAEYTKNNEYCSRSAINCATETDINEILKDLERREVIATHGEKGFKIRVGLFKEWLNENPTIWE